MPELPNITPPDLLGIMRPRRICSCVQLTREDLVEAMKNGATTFAKLQKQTGCCTGCTTCETSVHSLIRDFKKNGE